ncbi:cystathionine gamma-lyase [Aliiroseovarius halocynthiae]|uniref:Cystathionine gamma-lyase n=1 Tax=Aliiroseovarius halocynthiae TaxID=985055 RepID=A0A545SW27_9RHOB|nr:cystathionine gamma-lyase [Aliiroseovarius halocynthiae]TQV69151.1 cystathionine gamma-lyase [Aliiroseovarius halocynthiae]SMR71911.1 cystathionine gamma-lyase [Aliiroseovarius halocynthiae]
MSETPKDLNPLSRAAELLHHRGRALSKGEPIALPITTSSMFHLPGDPADSPAYGRVDNPTWEALEDALSILEDAPCVALPSGMAAISAALFASLGAGKRLLVPSDGYYVTRVLSSEFLAGFGVSVTERPTASIAEGGFADFDVVFIETPSNPGLDLCDLPAICGQVRAAGGITIVDNTTMTPFGQRPLDLGADIVVASDTKAPGGHSDLLMGHVATRDPAWLARVKDWRKMSGCIPSPHAAWALYRGLETLELRFSRMCDSAAVIAPVLAAHPAVRSARFPGLPSDPSHNLAAAQMERFGFLIGLDLGTEARAEQFINTSNFLRPATSFGGVHSSAERRARWGDDVSAGYVRLSVGCEPVDVLMQDLVDSLGRLED